MMQRQRIHRWLAMILIVGVLFAVAGCGGGKAEPGATGGDQPAGGSQWKGKTLNVLSWEGYQEDEWVKPFAEKYGVTVNVTYAGAVDEMFAKVKSGSTKYDLVFLDSGSVVRYQKQGLIQPIDVSKLGNYSQQIKTMQDLNNQVVTIDGKVWGIGYAWGSLPMAVNTEKITDNVDSWSALWDPKYAGKVLTLDDANNQVAMTALLLGYPDAFNLTDEQQEAVKQKLIEQKPLVRSYYAGFEDGKNLLASGEAWIAYTMGPTMITDLQKQGLPIVEVIPKEGALVWIDNAAIGAQSENVDLVHAYIDHLVSAGVQAQMIAKTAYGGTNAEAVKSLTPEQVKNAHMGDENYFSNLVLMTFPESFEKRVKLWNDVKAAQ